MSSNIHGWRVFSLARCEKVPDAPILRGAAGMHLHQRVQSAAKCNGFSGALWMTETAREKQSKTVMGSVPHEGPSPDWDCTCGAYFWTAISKSLYARSAMW